MKPSIVRFLLILIFCSASLNSNPRHLENEEFKILKLFFKSDPELHLNTHKMTQMEGRSRVYLISGYHAKLMGTKASKTGYHSKYLPQEKILTVYDDAFEVYAGHVSYQMIKGNRILKYWNFCSEKSCKSGLSIDGKRFKVN